MKKIVAIAVIMFITAAVSKSFGQVRATIVSNLELMKYQTQFYQRATRFPHDRDTYNWIAVGWEDEFGPKNAMVLINAGVINHLSTGDVVMVRFRSKPIGKTGIDPDDQDPQYIFGEVVL